MNKQITAAMKNSGVTYFSWTETFEELIEYIGTEQVCYLTLAKDYIIMGRADAAARMIEKISKQNRVHLNQIYPLAESNIQRYKDGCTGGRPVNYAKNVDFCVQNLNHEYHRKDFKQILVKWFEHLNKNKISTKKEDVQNTIKEFARLTKNVNDAIAIVKTNLNENNFKLDFEILRDLDDGLELDE
jgi:hypothetical protein